MKDPIHLSLVYLTGSFIVFLIILRTAKPYWIQNRDIYGNNHISYRLLFSFALTFALVVAIAVLLITNKTQSSIAFRPDQPV